MSLPTILDGDADILLLCDHASNVVPEGIALGVAPELLDLHIAVDIGAEPLTRALSERLDAPAILATVSRLVIDLHREPEHPDLIPRTSDGHVIPGNAEADREERIGRFHRPYHEALARLIDAKAPKLLASIHSFTPRLEHGGAARPWQAGILYNEDDRAARVAIDLLRARGIETGDNEPYSGKLLNATLNRHGEARALPYLAIEVRNDLISDVAGVVRWTAILSEIITETRNRVA
ncbi:MAG TPA: N-formylglutamate amidohydrolase [Sphingomonas sp.]|nr:N-formylglutamate amidohydrolase [Sphingomonas sp.]